MKRKFLLTIFFLFVVLAFKATYSQVRIPATYNENVKLDWLRNWFRAWELVCKEELSLASPTIPKMVFFDDTYVYTTSEVTITEANYIEGPALFGKPLSWRMAPHHGQLTLPDGQKVPVGLMTFAAPTSDSGSFFVMAAPTFWKSAGIESKEVGLEKMLTGVFLHEFAHTQQLPGFGAQVSAIEQQHSFDISLSDDIVQDYFKKDSSYTSLFRKEVHQFYEAAFSKNKKQATSLAKEGLRLLKKRQETYFVHEKAILNTLDDLFLSMEGLGQYVAVAWLTHPKGGNIQFDVAVEGFRRKRNQWSQEEGLALFLLYKKLGKPHWPMEMFGPQPQTIISLLEQIVATSKER